MSISRILLLATLVPAALPAQSDPIAESRAHYQEAVRAYEARDLEGFLRHAREAHALRPAHGGVAYAFASAQALTGDTAGAIRTLHHFAALGYAADVAADSDFVSLHASPAWNEVADRLSRNREPVVVSSPAFELADSALLTEGVAYDARWRVFYVSSVHQGRILRVTRDGAATPFATLEDGRLAPLGLRVDERRGLLWVAAAALPQTRGYAQTDSGRSALLRYDLRSGRLTGRFEPKDGRPHVLGDVVIARDGEVYATDSRSPVIYRAVPKSDSLEAFVESPLLQSAQGLALTPDGRTLYVADYSRGLMRVDLRSRGVSQMETAPDVLALGIDGLYLHDGALIGIQNGVTPHRVARFTLSPAGDRIVRAEVLERAHPRYNEPTLGVLVNDELYYVANSQWERFGGNGGIAHPDSLRRPVVLRLPL